MTFEVPMWRQGSISLEPCEEAWSFYGQSYNYKLYFHAPFLKDARMHETTLDVSRQLLLLQISTRDLLGAQALMKFQTTGRPLFETLHLLSKSQAQDNE